MTQDFVLHKNIQIVEQGALLQVAQRVGRETWGRYHVVQISTLRYMASYISKWNEYETRCLCLTATLHARGITLGNTKHEVREGLEGWNPIFAGQNFQYKYIYTGPKWKEQGQHPHPSSWLNKKLSKIVDIRWDQVNCTSINITSVHVWGCIVHCGIHKSNWVV